MGILQFRSTISLTIYISLPALRYVNEFSHFCLHVLRTILRFPRYEGTEVCNIWQLHERKIGTKSKPELLLPVEPQPRFHTSTYLISALILLHHPERF